VIADMGDEFGPWQPLSPQQVSVLFRSAAFSWWIAGGWTIDLFLGRQTRSHDDIDVLVLRRDQLAVRDIFAGWDVQAALPSTPEWPFQEWRVGETLQPHVHDIWCCPDEHAPWALQLMIDDTDGDRWLCRREPRIAHPITNIGRLTSEGIPYLSPEIQLLYKAKGMRPKDQEDFRQALPHLDHDSRDWLKQALLLVHPDHPWLDQILP
jgi:hypothetical protein